jgi:hypothetical protein
MCGVVPVGNVPTDFSGWLESSYSGSDRWSYAKFNLFTIVKRQKCSDKYGG